MRTQDTAIERSGEHITERVAEVAYPARDPPPDGYRDVFALGLDIPDD
jgi:hypothetical protein